MPAVQRHARDDDLARLAGAGWHAPPRTASSAPGSETAPLSAEIVRVGIGIPSSFTNRPHSSTTHSSTILPVI